MVIRIVVNIRSRSCYSTLVANMANCESSSVTNVVNTGRRKRSETVIEERPMAVVDQDGEDQVQPLDEVIIQATKVLYIILEVMKAIYQRRVSFQVQDVSDTELARSEEANVQPSPYFLLIETTTKTIMQFNTVFEAQAATQTIRLTTPGCFPSALFSSLSISQC